MFLLTVISLSSAHCNVKWTSCVPFWKDRFPDTSRGLDFGPSPPPPHTLFEKIATSNIDYGSIPIGTWPYFRVIEKLNCLILSSYLHTIIWNLTTLTHQADSGAVDTVGRGLEPRPGSELLCLPASPPSKVKRNRAAEKCGPRHQKLLRNRFPCNIEEYNWLLWDPIHVEEDKKSSYYLEHDRVLMFLCFYLLLLDTLMLVFSRLFVCPPR